MTNVIINAILAIMVGVMSMILVGGDRKGLTFAIGFVFSFTFNMWVDWMTGKFN